ncbi:MAG: hypothetical protein K8S98_04335 [Planctomycetes bacterium]|nr:hypothetical protein [Planctomycetota bacterium]
MHIHEIDWQRSFTGQILKAVDGELRAVAERCSDGLDLREEQEELAGIAFIALQRYVSSADASLRRVFLTLPAKDHELRRQDCRSVADVPVVEGIWAAANHWKHHDEWPDWKPVGARKPTIEVLTRLGVSHGTEFPCLELIRSLTGLGPGAVCALLDAASDWRATVFNRLRSLESP